MANTNVNIRMDSELKKEFESICSDFGMSMTTAFTIFAKRVVRDAKIPFEINAIRPDIKTVMAIEEGDRIIREHDYGKLYDNVDDLFADLDLA